MPYIICAIFGYLLGSINASVIYSHFKGRDIRTVGSGNAGATNTLRTFGKKAALFVVFVDILKGVIAVLLARTFGNTYCAYCAGFAAILGHNFPLYFGFRGGKGIITSLAVMCMTAPQEAFIALFAAILVIAVTRYVSLGSVLGSLLFGILSIIRSQDIYFTVFVVLVVLLAIIRHHSNISRLIRGTERKLGK